MMYDCWNEMLKKYVMKVSFTGLLRTIFWALGLNFFLNSFKEWENLISNGTSSYILGPRNDKDSVPQWTVFIFSNLNS